MLQGKILEKCIFVEIFLILEYLIYFQNFKKTHFLVKYIFLDKMYLIRQCLVLLIFFSYLYKHNY